MVINIEVKLVGIFQRVAGKKYINLKVEEPASVRMIILKLLKKFSEEFKQVLIDSQLDNPIPNALILVGGKEINSLQGLETRVRDTEEIVLLPIAHGG